MRLINRRIESALLLVHFYIKENQPRLIGGIDRSIHMRLIFVAKFKDKVYILHCFQKKSQKTAKKDIDLALKRYTDLVKEISS